MRKRMGSPRIEEIYWHLRATALQKQPASLSSEAHILKPWHGRASRKEEPHA